MCHWHAPGPGLPAFDMRQQRAYRLYYTRRRRSSPPQQKPGYAHENLLRNETMVKWRHSTTHCRSIKNDKIDDGHVRESRMQSSQA